MQLALAMLSKAKYLELAGNMVDSDFMNPMKGVAHAVLLEKSLDAFPIAS